MRNMLHWRRRPGEIPRARRGWLTPLAPAVLALAMLAAACGGSSGADGDGVASGGRSGSKTSDSSKKTDPQQAALDFARCMREHGVDMPDPEVTDDGLMKIGPGAAADDATQSGELPGSEEAHQACRHHLEDLVQDGAAKVDPKEQDRALKFAKCMRDNGVNMPDPDFSKGGATFSLDAGSAFDPSSETFKEAQKACGNLFGPGGGGPGVAPREGGTS